MFSTLMKIILGQFKRPDKEEKCYFTLTPAQKSSLCFLENANNMKYWRKKGELKIERISHQMCGTKRNLLKMIEFLRQDMYLANFQEYIEIRRGK